MNFYWQYVYKVKIEELSLKSIYSDGLILILKSSKNPIRNTRVTYKNIII